MVELSDMSETVNAVKSKTRQVAVKFTLQEPWEWDPFDFERSAILLFDGTFDEKYHQRYGIENIEALFPYDEE